MDEVQCGHFRTGRFQSWQRLLDGVAGAEGFSPDGVSMAKSLGGGFPIGAFWVRQPYADLLGPGTHASTFGGTPLGCAVALRILEVIEHDQLAANARAVGDFLKAGLKQLAARHPEVVIDVRGVGLMVCLELAPNLPALSQEGRTAAAQFTNLLHAAGLLAIPTGTHVIRFLPALNLHRAEAEEALKIVESVVASLARS